MMIGLIGINMRLLAAETSKYYADMLSAEQDRKFKELREEMERKQYGKDAIDVEARVIEDVPLLQNSDTGPDREGK